MWAMSPFVKPRHIPSVSMIAELLETTEAWQLLDKRVANSRVGPLARWCILFGGKLFGSGISAAERTKWVRPLMDSLWQPVDICTILAIFMFRAQLMKGLHATTSCITKVMGKDPGPYDQSVFPVLGNALLRFGQLLLLLLLADAGSYTCAMGGVISKTLAGQIPDTLDTIGYAVVFGFLVTRVKTHYLRFIYGMKASASQSKLTGSAALIDRLSGAAVWGFMLLGGAQVLSMELGFRLKSILALGGLGSLAFGLACQTPLANVLKGLIIAASGAFATGEKIKAAGMTGVVEDFGWYACAYCTLRLAVSLFDDAFFAC